MEPKDYNRILRAAPDDYFENITDDDGLMAYANAVCDEWIASRYPEEEEVSEELYTFLMSFGVSMFVQGYSVRDLRIRDELQRAFDGKGLGEGVEETEEEDADE